MSVVVPHGAQFGVRWHSGLAGIAVPSASSRNMEWEQWGGGVGSFDLPSPPGSTAIISAAAL